MPLISVHCAADVSAAAPVARAMYAAGIPLIQVALDGPLALEAIGRISTETPDVIVGAGAITHIDQPELARAAGAEFLVATEGPAALRHAMRATELPHLPGVTTVAQAAELLQDGYLDMVVHPAASAGGLRHLRTLAAFVPDARFCVSGGVTAADLTGYLAAPNVGCVSADWLAPADAVRRRDWERIRRLADVALKLSKPTVTAVRAL